MPLGQIQAIPSTPHISFDQPRERGHVAVPWPDGVVGVAIDTRPIEHRSNRRRKLQLVAGRTVNVDLLRQTEGMNYRRTHRE